MSLTCPRCTEPLGERPVSDLVLHECGRCAGLFLDRATVDQILAERAHADHLLAALPQGMASPVVRAGQRMYVPCPVCQTLMNRKLFAAGAGVVLDVCKAHGTFFDAGELPAIIAFVMKGGLEKAAKSTQAEAERRRRQEAAGRVAVSAQPGGTGSFDAADALDAGGALVNLLFSLFG